MTGRRLAVVAALGYWGCVVAANWIVDAFGAVPVAPGLRAPAAVYLVGLALVLRDLVQLGLGRGARGRLAVVGLVLAGSALSAAVSPVLALASGVAFLVSELLDFAAYTVLERRGWLAAVAASQVVGAVVDSVLFLWLAFGSFEFLPGQVVGKLAMGAAAVALLALGRSRGLLPRHA